MRLTFPTEEKNHSSDLSFHSSEVLLLAYVEDFLFSRAYPRFPTWRVDGD